MMNKAAFGTVIEQNFLTKRYPLL